MFGITKKLLLDNLLSLKKTICLYHPPTQSSKNIPICDCKYSLSDNDSSESTMCPEILMCYKLIDSLSEKEFKDMCEKAGIMILQ